ncbi:MAG: glycosyltransferase family 2 protein [Chlorobi bacterium]|nr:glycosyltransferase family 2 protein [Chlorobiota bacterium]
MKAVGFTFVRNAILLDYPVKEAIESVLPLVDEFVVAVGRSDDGTRELVQSIAPGKIRIIDTEWDESLRTGGRVLAAETDKALAAVPADADWAFYIQADEVVHEDDYPAIREAMHKYADCKRVDGLLFDYVHFYGSYDWTGASYKWYRHEVRIIRPGRGIFSYRDAQGFRRPGGKRLRVVPSGGRIFHYGWVRDPVAMGRKQKLFRALWHAEGTPQVDVRNTPAYAYDSEVRALEPFRGTHPRIIHERIARKNWKFDPPPGYRTRSFKDRFKAWVEKHTGYYIGFKNYRRIRPGRCVRPVKS